MKIALSLHIFILYKYSASYFPIYACSTYENMNEIANIHISNLQANQNCIEIKLCKSQRILLYSFCSSKEEIHQKNLSDFKGDQQIKTHKKAKVLSTITEKQVPGQG